MTETAPAPSSPPAPGGGHASFLDHVRAWFARDVAPDIADIRIKAGNAAADAEKVLAWAQAQSAHEKQLASLILTLAQVLDPAAYPAAAAVVTGAEAALAEAEKIAGKLGPSRM